VWVFAICWNDAHMLPFFFRHYDDWVDRYVMFDDGSTDGTLAVLTAHPNVEVRRFQRRVADSFVHSATLLQNEVWKEARGRADWAVVTAVDEHLYHPDVTAYLTRCRAGGVTAIPALGFHMLSETFPSAGERLCDTRPVGAPHWEMCKLSLLDPRALEETNYSPGRHFAEPTGRVNYPETDELLNLHYKFMGRDQVAARHRLLASGLGEADKAEGMGKQYAWSRQELDAHWQSLAATALDHRDPSVGFATHIERWWRGPRRR